MRVGIVTEAVPNPGTSGGDTVNWAILKHLREAGHEVRPCCLLVNQWAAERPEAMRRHVSALERLGVSPQVFRIPEALAGGWLARWRQAVWPDTDRLFPAVQLAPQLRRALETAQPDAVFVFDNGTMAAMRGVRVAPRFVVPGDPPHLVHAYRRKLPLREIGIARGLAVRAAGAVWSWRVGRMILKMLREFEAAGFLGAQHAAWLRANGIPCLYLRPTVVDVAGPRWEALRDACTPRLRPKILVLGSHQGTASLTGLYAFADTTIPCLERALGPTGFEVHIVGKGPLPPQLERRLSRPSVRLRGYVDDVVQEYLSCDVFVSPTPYPVGVRTRVIDAFSYGCCVVTDPSSALGLPELVDGDNVLLALAGRGWAEAILRALKDDGLRQTLGRNARRTYERFFTPAATVGQIVVELERIALKDARDGTKASFRSQAAPVESMAAA